MAWLLVAWIGTEDVVRPTVVFPTWETCQMSAVRLMLENAQAPAAGGGGYISMTALGIAFSTAITACVTTDFADNAANAPAASAYIINFFYK